MRPKQCNYKIENDVDMYKYEYEALVAFDAFSIATS